MKWELTILSTIIIFWFEVYRFLDVTPKTCQMFNLCKSLG
ncbi:hypothetical protein ADU37_CDS13910 [Thermococcus sp. 2319x1]|nr:hypothetical protein ADU37_CDS13910 [Thermococcus sp. 2319x1]